MLRRVLWLACEIAMIAAVAGVSAWPTRATRADAHRLALVWLTRRDARPAALVGNPTALAAHAALTQLVDRTLELDPYSAEPEQLERLLDRHVELSIALAQIRSGDELARARARRELGLRREGDPARVVGRELATLTTLVTLLAQRAAEPDEPPPYDEVARFIAATSARPRSTAA